MTHEPKISLPERVLILILSLAQDGFEFIAIFSIPTFGPFLPVLAGVSGFFLSAILIIWFIMKKVSIRWLLSGSGIELIPVINSFPIRTAGVIATFIEDSIPISLKPEDQKSEDKEKEKKEVSGKKETEKSAEKEKLESTEDTS